MRVTLGRVNLVLYAAIVLTGALYGRELRWAARAFPGYLTDSIAAPRERALELAARPLVDGNEWEQEQAERLLEESLAIDPRGEARYWLGELERHRGRPDEALAHYRAYLEIDPGYLEAYLKMSAVEERRGHRPEALAVLRAGRDYFAAHVERYLPELEGGDAQAKRKAIETYARYRLAARLLAGEIERLEVPGAP